MPKNPRLRRVPELTTKFLERNPWWEKEAEAQQRGRQSERERTVANTTSNSTQG